MEHMATGKAKAVSKVVVLHFFMETSVGYGTSVQLSKRLEIIVLK
jgi:hypothetical protein